MNDNDKSKSGTLDLGQQSPQSGSFTPDMVQSDAPPPPPPSKVEGASTPTQTPNVQVSPQNTPSGPEVNALGQGGTNMQVGGEKYATQQTPVAPSPSPAQSPGNLGSTIPPQEVVSQTPNVQVSQNVQTPPPSQPPPQMGRVPMQSPTGSDVVTASSSRKGFSKIIFILFGIILVLGLVGLAYKFVLPMFQKEDVTTITWWGLWEDKAIVEPLIQEYETKNPNIKINYVRQSKEDYRERLMNTLAKGEGPDIFRFHNTWVPMFKNELDNVPASFMSAADYAQTYYPVTQSDMSSGAGLVGVPLGYDALTLYINEDMFAEAGLNAPTTWDDLRAYAKTLTKRENGIITQAGVALGRTENVDHWPEIIALMMLQNGVNLVDPTGNNAEDALVFYTLFSEKDGVWDETLPASTVAFANGKLAMYFGPSWRAFNIQELNPNLKFKTVLLPQVPKDKPDEPSYSYATYWVEGVWGRSPNKEIAWDFLKFMSTRASLEKFFQSASNSRGFGEIYPQVGMAELLVNDPILGSINTLAPDARSWYLADRTFDGPTGINTQINKYFEDAINKVIEGEDPEDALAPAAKGVIQVLSEYGLVRRSSSGTTQ